jgi:hypothetical protein
LLDNFSVDERREDLLLKITIFCATCKIRSILYAAISVLVFWKSVKPLFWQISLFNCVYKNKSACICVWVGVCVCVCVCVSGWVCKEIVYLQRPSVTGSEVHWMQVQKKNHFLAVRTFARLNVKCKKNVFAKKKKIWILPKKWNVTLQITSLVVVPISIWETIRCTFLKPF